MHAVAVVGARASVADVSCANVSLGGDQVPVVTGLPPSGHAEPEGRLTSTLSGAVFMVRRPLVQNFLRVTMTAEFVMKEPTVRMALAPRLLTGICEALVGAPMAREAASKIG